MSASLNEVQALIKGAARGAGLLWGEAMEYAQAMRWLLSRGIDAVPVCVDHLEQMKELVRPTEFVTDIRGGGPLCPFRVGILISDHSYMMTQAAPIVVHDLSYPVLILPYLAPIGVRVSGTGFDVTVGSDGWQGQLPDMVQADVRIDVVDTNASHPMTTRVNLDNCDKYRLLVMAEKTYAPATEESRLAGAGAGLCDND